MLDSSNFVLYNTSGGIIWQSFDHPTDTILQTQSLLTGKELLSSVSGTEYSRVRFHLKMQYDGNLVQYPENTTDTATYAYWASNTWVFGTSVDYEVKLDVDGHLYINQKFGCICLEGFVYVDQEKQYSSCQRNFSNRHGAVNYAIQELDNYYFEDVSYKVLQVFKEDCKQACLEDSNCEAALFGTTNGNFRMQRLPLRFAGKDPNDDSSNIFLVKVEVTSSSTDSGPIELKESKKHLPISLLVI
ncbi:hypothetical protein Patl1_27825 [Pistacia atlantica]|uniref:Uncharacterized protein n=1 Tax=Pistacia atlantica TaxID=434234 RepID=A0ACC1BG02_9ROSI|nr:hypothetical protein Patl1_27825 [Pistacia atlantica]